MIVGNGALANRIIGNSHGSVHAHDSSIRGVWGRQNRMMGGFSAVFGAQPSGGYLHPYAFTLPRSPGALSATMRGEGEFDADAWAVRLAEAAITGSGSLTAFGSLIVQLIAAITGSGTVTNADVKAFLAAVAALTGSGDITNAARTGLGALISAMTGSGTADGSTATATGELSADIVAYGDLTPEGIRDAVWNAFLANYQTDGTAGKALSTASSGGVDYEALAAAILAAAQTTPIHSDVRKVTGTSVTGAGTEADPWGP